MASLDYYYGRAVEDVVFGQEDWQWAIVLGGNAIIKNWDKRRTSPPELSKGEGFLLATFDEDATTLKFGSVNPATQSPVWSSDVVLTPTQYSITDPDYATDEEFPQRQTEMVAESAAMVYPEELLAREAQGPEIQEDENGEEAESGQSAEDDGDTGAGSEADSE